MRHQLSVPYFLASSTKGWESSLLLEMHEGQSIDFFETFIHE